MDLTQEGLATRVGVKFATYRRFEQTGEISLNGLLKIGFALDALSEFDALSAQERYRSSDEALKIFTRYDGKEWLVKFRAKRDSKHIGRMNTIILYLQKMWN